ncbi:MAG: L-cysteine/cystine lyase, partial [Solirubrobacteraceae bacterium]|nr:L-cysteine/cystine lyase [Solirubrobacteraceae bacterium]
MAPACREIRATGPSERKETARSHPTASLRGHGSGRATRLLPGARAPRLPNAGTCGPLPAAAARAAIETIEQAAEEGRSGPYFEGLAELRTRLRDGYAQLLGAAPDDVALTTCTSEGMVRVLAALALGPGDEVLTSTEEHPG